MKNMTERVNSTDSICLVGLQRSGFTSSFPKYVHILLLRSEMFLQACHIAPPGPIALGFPAKGARNLGQKAGNMK
jgi:hypothetical protein